MEAEHPLALAFERYSPQLRRYLYKHSSDIHAVDDMLQQVFVEALRTWSRYEDRGFQLSAWLYAIARSRLGDHCRRVSRRSRETAIAPWHATDEDLHTRVEASEERSELWAAVAKLPHRQRLVIELRFRDAWPPARVANAMGVTEGSVKAMQHRALATLAKQLCADTTPRVCAEPTCVRPLYRAGLCWRHHQAARPKPRPMLE